MGYLCAMLVNMPLFFNVFGRVKSLFQSRPAPAVVRANCVTLFTEKANAPIVDTTQQLWLQDVLSCMRGIEDSKSTLVWLAAVESDAFFIDHTDKTIQSLRTGLITNTTSPHVINIRAVWGGFCSRCYREQFLGHLGLESKESMVQRGALSRVEGKRTWCYRVP